MHTDDHAGACRAARDLRSRVMNRGAFRAMFRVALVFGGTLALTTGVLSGCESGQKAGGSAESASTATAAASGRTVATDTTIRKLDETMLIGPTAARQLGYRIDWEAPSVAGTGVELAWFAVLDDSVFAVDTINNMVRLNAETGTRIWTAPVGGPYERLHGADRVDTDRGDRVYVLGEGDMFVLDAANGVLVERQRLDRVANTAPVRFGRYFIYGTRSGQIVWHQFAVGHPWRLNQIDGSIRVPPLIAGNDVLAVSSGGDIMMMNGPTAMRTWKKTLLDGISAAPAAGEGPDGERLVFVAAEDQYLWALRQEDGRTAWNAFFEAPLTSPPILIGERLFVQVPDRGLICFDAFPDDSVEGVELWTSPAPGVVIGQRGQRILVWDAEHRLLSLVDVQRGRVIDTFELPQVEQIRTTAPMDGDLYAASRDGRLTRLVKP